VDSQTLDLLRFEVKANDVPPSLNLELADNAINYARRRIGGGDFLLPVSSEVLLRDLEGNENRNRTSFGQCRQFSGESVISFGDADLAAARQTTPASVGPKTEIQLPLEFRVFLSNRSGELTGMPAASIT
jgi:hypothetical protein